MPQTSKCHLLRTSEKWRRCGRTRGAEGARYAYRIVDKAVFSKNQDLPIKNKFLNSNGYINIIGLSKFS